MNVALREARRDGRGRLQQNTADALWSLVNKTDGCWLWTGRQDEAGYGRIGFRGKQNVGAHRVSWELTNGPIPKGMWVLHRCDTPLCVNPAHLFLGDATDNNRDRQEKGRTKGWAGRTGEAHHAFRASPELLARAHELRANGATQQAIAEATGISRGHISKLLRGIQ